MKLQNEKTQRHRALLAIAFAGSAISSQLPAFSEDSKNSPNTVEQRITQNAQFSPEIRAFYLLLVANAFLMNQNESEIMTHFVNNSSESNDSWSFKNWRRFHIFDSRYFSGNRYGFINNPKKSKSTSEPRLIRESITRANATVAMALEQLKNVTDPCAKLDMYFAAMSIFRRTENAEGIEICKKVLDGEFQRCEGENAVDEERIHAATAILNLMANDKLEVYIPDFNPDDLQLTPGQSFELKELMKVKPFTELQFKESEALRLRALRMTDHLASNNHLRRKAHRDMHLWYTQVNHKQLAALEKKVLFDLVGFEDDSILYPQSGACGHFIWWRREKITSVGGCGMG